MRWVAVSLAVLALAGCSGGDEKPPVVFEKIHVHGSRGDWERMINRTPRGDWERVTNPYPQGDWDRMIRRPRHHRRVVARPISDPALEARIKKAAEESGARVVDVTIFDFGVGQPAPAVRLQSDDIYSYLRYHASDFKLTEALRSGDKWPNGYLVELYDAQGKWAWSTGTWSFGGGIRSGFVGSATPEIDACQPVAHSYPVTLSGSPRPDCPVG